MARKDTRVRKGDRHKPRKDTRKGDRHKKLEGTTLRADHKPSAFLAIDGEGWGKTIHGVQHYQLMVAANDTERYVLDTGKPLQTDEILDWLASLPKPRTLISFSFGYDVTMLAKHLPTEKKVALVKRDDRLLISRGWRKGQPRPVYHSGHALDWLPRKFFSINGRKIYDTWSFFGKSLMATLEMWDVCTPDEMAIIAHGKAGRINENQDREEQIKYCTLENIALCRIMEKIRSMCRALGYPLTSFYGAGSVASAIMKRHGVNQYLSPLSSPVEDAATRAFFGGRFETASIGEFDDVHYYDIVSAYPTIIRDLPCLACGTWVLVPGYLPNWKHAVWHVKWDLGLVRSWAPFPHRSADGRITFPGRGEGWYWADEVRAAVEMFGQGPFFADNWERPGIEIIEGHVYDPSCEHKPFDFVDDLFRKRAEYKAQGMAEQLVIKLGLNSLYGKTAQSAGAPKYASPVWGGMITSGTRATLLRAIAQAPDDVLSTATDSISSRVPLNLPIGKKLGQWEYEHVAHIFLAGDGMSYSVDNERRTRTRGIGAKDVVWDLYLDAWRNGWFGGKAKFKTTRFEGLATMVARGKPELAGHWHTSTRVLGFISGKRVAFGAFTKPHNTLPPPAMDGGAMSARYAKTIGGAMFDQERCYEADAKDVEFLFDETPV